MMTGHVTALREATIPLTVRSLGQHQQDVDTVIDTGFNGFLTLPRHLVHALQRPFVGHRRATLGDGSSIVLEVYLALVLWHAQEREVLVLQADGGPLIGMSLLYGSRVVFHVVVDGDVIIEPWP